MMLKVRQDNISNKVQRGGISQGSAAGYV